MTEAEADGTRPWVKPSVRPPPLLPPSATRDFSRISLCPGRVSEGGVKTVVARPRVI